ncbi:winged helix-turn-helix domain-containing protein [Kitasatospora aureofaciens]|uniref:winged helix-turn-helix domain-containing protein n=1 Tax=Kitasatospora aureofaciens TaxID=1894 RepID=UPI0037C62CC7
MLQLRLSVDDLSRIRVIDTLGLAFEAHLAWNRLTEQRRDVFSEWRRTVRSRSRRSAPTPGPAESRGTLLDALTSGRPAEGDSFPAEAVEPFWGRIHQFLRAERDACGREVVTGGMEQVLNNRHPSVVWRSPTLRIDNLQPSREISLVGQGLTLAPSLFAPRPFLIDREMGWRGLPVLVYNVVPSVEDAATIWNGSSARAALQDLLGRTRADVLDSLRESQSTGQVADRLRISTPSASKHITVLRRAGFVTTERRHNSTVHALTPLGETLLG